MKILKTPWKNEFLELVSQSKESIKITSPFIKTNICQELLSEKDKQSKLEVYTSFKLFNIHSGSLDLDGIESLIQQKGIVRNIPKLHSKIYLFDNSKVIITSGNLTNGGLVNNFEYGIYTEDKLIVNQVSKDFDSFSKNKDVGTIKLTDIEVVRNILSKIPKSKTVKIPRYDFDPTNENKYDTLEIPENVLSTSLKGWKLEVLKCAQSINSKEFTLNEINKYEPYLKEKYPNNNHITDKIRQQLQYLRDFGLIEFLGNGKYRKLWK